MLLKSHSELLLNVEYIFWKIEVRKFIEIAIQVANLKPERYQSKIYLVTMIAQISVIKYYKKYEILKSNP